MTLELGFRSSLLLKCTRLACSAHSLSIRLGYMDSPYVMYACTAASATVH